MRVAAAAPPTPVAGAVIAAPPVPAPAPVPIVMVSANSAIHDFNYSNPSAVFLSATSTLVNKHIFQNPAAALPLTVYVGMSELQHPVPSFSNNTVYFLDYVQHSWQAKCRWTCLRPC